MSPGTRAALLRRTTAESMLHVVETWRVRLRAHIERTGLGPEELALLRAVAGGTEVPWEVALARSSMDAALLASAMESLVSRGALTWARETARESIVLSITPAGTAALARASAALGPPVRW